MAGGNLLSRSRIIHILNAVTTEHQAPVGLRLCGKLGDDAFVHRSRLVKFAGSPQAVGAGEKRQFLFAVSRGHGLPGAAIFALRHGHACFDIQISAAHFAFDDGHTRFSPCILFDPLFYIRIAFLFTNLVEPRLDFAATLAGKQTAQGSELGLQARFPGM